MLGKIPFAGERSWTHAARVPQTYVFGRDVVLQVSFLMKFSRTVLAWISTKSVPWKVLCSTPIWKRWYKKERQKLVEIISTKSAFAVAELSTTDYIASSHAYCFQIRVSYIHAWFQYRTRFLLLSDWDFYRVPSKSRCNLLLNVCACIKLCQTNHNTD